MSYVRFGNGGSDVYMFGTTTWKGDDHVIECCGCVLALEPNPEWDEWDRVTPLSERGLFDGPPMVLHNGKPDSFSTYQEVLDHIAEHRAAGHCVPDFVDADIRAEMALPDGHDDRWLPNGDPS